MTAHLLRPTVTAIAVACCCVMTTGLLAQGGRQGASPAMSDATTAMRAGRGADALAAVRRELQSNPTSRAAALMLDTLGLSAEAQPIFEKLVGAAAEPLAKANAERDFAMSYAFAGDCANTVAHEQKVIDYWVSREQAEPQNAFYQEGEIANEAARVCIDAGDLKAAEAWYRKGAELGLKEPGNQTHPKSLWDFRLAHALGRVAARRGDAAEAKRQIAAARKALDGDPAMAAQQERFFPYLVGYVALYTDDLSTARTSLTEAIQTSGNQSDPFMLCLLAMTGEKAGNAEQASASYQKAFGLATAHNPPAAFTRRVAREKLGLKIPS